MSNLQNIFSKGYLNLFVLYKFSLYGKKLILYGNQHEGFSKISKYEPEIWLLLKYSRKLKRYQQHGI